MYRNFPASNAEDDNFMTSNFRTNEPQHEIFNNVVCPTSKASDQPEHKPGLIRAFASS